MGDTWEAATGGTWDAATGDTWDGTRAVLGGPVAQVWAAEVVDQGVVADLLWMAEVGDQGVVADLLWVAEAVVGGRVEALAEQEVAEPGPEGVVLVEAGAPELAEVEVLAEAVVAAVAVKSSCAVI